MSTETPLSNAIEKHLRDAEYTEALEAAERMEAVLHTLAGALEGRSFLAITHSHLWTPDCTAALDAYRALLPSSTEAQTPPR